MNRVLFACPKCRLYIDAGYKWAYWMLEDPGLVKRREIVDVDAVLNHNPYWNPKDDGENSVEWLTRDTLPMVRRFLEEHGEHGVLYIDEDDIFREDSLYYNWKEIETYMSGGNLDAGKGWFPPDLS